MLFNQLNEGIHTIHAFSLPQTVTYLGQHMSQVVSWIITLSRGLDIILVWSVSPFVDQLSFTPLYIR
jgi:hypothetical protein